MSTQSGLPYVFSTAPRYQLLRQQRGKPVSTTMGILSLCADSARPPGMTTNEEYLNGTCVTLGSKMDCENLCKSPSTLLAVSNKTVTTYYLPSNLTPSTMPGLHATRAMVSHSSPDTRPLPLCHYSESLSRVNFPTLSSLHDNIVLTHHSNNMTATWQLISLLMFVISLFKLFISSPKRKSNSNRKPLEKSANPTNEGRTFVHEGCITRVKRTRHN